MTPSENGAPHDGRPLPGGVRPPSGASGTPGISTPPAAEGHGASMSGATPAGGSLPGSPSAGSRFPTAPNFDAPADLPSDAALTRLANELFAAPPGGGGGSPQSGPDLDSTFTNATSSRFGVSEEERLRATLPARLQDGRTPTTQAGPGVAAPPASGPSAINVPGLGAPGVRPSGRPSLAGAPATPAGVGYPAPSHPAPLNPVPPFYFMQEHAGTTTPAARAGGGAGSLPQFAATPPSAPAIGGGRRPFDVHAVRRDFPILQERLRGGKPLVWLDNAATTHKPLAVIERIAHYYAHENSNIHRAAHELAARSTDAYEQARTTVARFLNAPSAKEIVFVRGATEAINLVAQTWGRQNVGAGDEILITHLEHHANIVPWHRLCAETGCTLKVAPVDDRGDVILEEYQRLLNGKTRLVAFPQVSNALGTITPAREMVAMAHRAGALALVDGAQAVSHMRQDVTALDADFYVFSGHKVFAPTGIGVLYGKADVLDAMPPWQGGGNMIEDVTFERIAYQPPPMRFEAGTGSIADAVGLGAALEYVERLGIENIERYEHDLLAYATQCLLTVHGLRLVGTSPNKAGVLSFVINGLRTEDISSALSHEGIAVRAGHHCAQPILRRYDLESTVRPSLALYNTREEIDALTAALHRIRTGYGAGRA